MSVRDWAAGTTAQLVDRAEAAAAYLLAGWDRLPRWARVAVCVAAFLCGLSFGTF